MDPVHVAWVQLQVAGLSAEVWPASAARLRRDGVGGTGGNGGGYCHSDHYHSDASTNVHDEREIRRLLPKLKESFNRFLDVAIRAILVEKGTRYCLDNFVQTVNTLLPNRDESSNKTRATLLAKMDEPDFKATVETCVSGKSDRQLEKMFTDMESHEETASSVILGSSVVKGSSRRDQGQIQQWLGTRRQFDRVMSQSFLDKNGDKKWARRIIYSDRLPIQQVLNGIVRAFIAATTRVVRVVHAPGMCGSLGNQDNKTKCQTIIVIIIIILTPGTIIIIFNFRSGFCCKIGGHCVPLDDDELIDGVHHQAVLLATFQQVNAFVRGPDAELEQTVFNCTGRNGGPILQALEQLTLDTTFEGLPYSRNGVKFAHNKYHPTCNVVGYGRSANELQEGMRSASTQLYQDGYTTRPLLDEFMSRPDQFPAFTGTRKQPVVGWIKNQFGKVNQRLLEQKRRPEERKRKKHEACDASDKHLARIGYQPPDPSMYNAKLVRE